MNEFVHQLIRNFAHRKDRPVCGCWQWGGMIFSGGCLIYSDTGKSKGCVTMRLASATVSAIVLIAMSSAHAECVYKPVMTAEDLQACREADAAKVPPERPAQAPAPQKQWSAADQAAFEATQRRERERLAEKQRADSLLDRPTIGMSMTEAKEKTRAFGKNGACQFARVNRTTNAHGTHDQIVCGDVYYYFDNDILTTIQDHRR